MAQQYLDPTANESLQTALSKIEANFNELYTNEFAGPTGPTGPGATEHAGTFVANETTQVSVTDANVTANSVIVITLKTVGGTVGQTPYVDTITPTTGFTIKGQASDTSTYNYRIIA